MSKRNEREARSSSSSSSQYQPSPKRLLHDGTPGMEDDHVSLGNIMDKLCHVDKTKFLFHSPTDAVPQLL